MCHTLYIYDIYRDEDNVFRKSHRGKPINYICIVVDLLLSTWLIIACKRNGNNDLIIIRITFTTLRSYSDQYYHMISYYRCQRYLSIDKLPLFRNTFYECDKYNCFSNVITIILILCKFYNCQYRLLCKYFLSIFV